MAIGTEKHVAEFASAQLNDGVTLATFLQASSDMQHQFLDYQEGLISRHVWHDEGGRIGALLQWESAEFAHQAMGQAMANAAVQQFVSLIRPGSYQVAVTPLVQQFFVATRKES